jgi:hypothetical protein
MTNQTPEMRVIYERLEKLEKQNRKMRQLGLILLVFCAGLFGMAQVKPSQRVLEAEKIAFVSQEGMRIGTLGIDRVRMGLELCDAEGNQRLFLIFGAKDINGSFVPSEYTALHIKGKDQRAGMSLVADTHPHINIGNSGSINLYGTNAENPRISLGFNGDLPNLNFAYDNGNPGLFMSLPLEGPNLAFLDKNKVFRTILSYKDWKGWKGDGVPPIPTGSSLQFFGTKDKPQAGINASDEGSSVSLWDSNGNPRAALLHIVDKGSSITIFDGNGKVLFDKP